MVGCLGVVIRWFKVGPIPGCVVYLAQDLGTPGLKIAYENVLPRRAIYT